MILGLHACTRTGEVSSLVLETGLTEGERLSERLSHIPLFTHTRILSLLCARPQGSHNLRGRHTGKSTITRHHARSFTKGMCRTWDTFREGEETLT